MAEQIIKPIDNLEQIDRLRLQLHDSPRDLLLFDMCTQTGLPLKTLLSLRVADLAGLNPGDDIPGTETTETGSGILTDRVTKSFHKYLEKLQPVEEAFLFRSRKGDRPLNVSSVSHLVKNWFSQAGLIGLSGVKSLRKTWETHFGGRTEVDNIGKRRLNSVTVSTLGQMVRKELAREILAGRIAPGERLRINQIAAEMKVSPIPVRDALARLEASGFVTWSKRTYMVNSLSRDNLHELLFLRQLLEPVAARESCLNYAEQCLNSLRRTNSKLRELTGRNRSEVIDARIHLSREFHFTLYAGSNMPFLIEMINSVWQRLSPYMYFLAGESKTYPLSDMGLETHEFIIDAYADRDPEAIGECVREDIALSMKVPEREFKDFKGAIEE